MDFAKNHRLEAAFKEAVARITDGSEDPTEAILKVAADYSLKPGESEILCRSYNAGRSIAQMDHEDTAPEKVAHFALADTERVAMTRAIGDADDKKKTAKKAGSTGADPSVLLRKPEVKKASSAYLDRLRELNAADAESRKVAETRSEKYNRLRGEKLAEDRKALDARVALGSKLAALQSHFESRDAFPFAVYESEAARLYGEDGRSVSGWVSALCGKSDKSANVAGLACRRPVRPSEVPFSTTKEAADLAREIAAREAKSAELAAAMLDCLRPAKAAAAPAPELQPVSFEVKRDDFFDKLAFNPIVAVGTNAAGNGIGSRMNPAFADNHEKNRVNDYQKEIFNPEIDHEMRNIRAQALLTSMMTDEDSPISQHPPEDVARAYNEVAGFAPQVADQPLSLEPLLARTLKRPLEPFETEGIAALEKNMRSNNGLSSPTP